MSKPLPRNYPIRGEHALEDAALMDKVCRHLSWFALDLWSVIEPKRPLVWSWHMGLLCRKIEASYRREIRIPLVANIPPRCSKSTLFAVLGPAWWWLHEPQTQFLCLTKSQKNVYRDAGLMRRVISSARYLEIKAHLKTDWSLQEDRNRLTDFANTDGGHRVSLTTNSDVIGVGADVLLLDDPHDVDEIMGGTVERVDEIMEVEWERFQHVQEPRLNPGGRVQCIMQRVHPRDVAGRLHKRGAHSVVLPMEYEPDHDQVCPDDPRTEPGEPLTPNYLSEDDIARRKASAFKWATQDQQRPERKEGGQVKREWLNPPHAPRYTAPPEEMAQTCDEVWTTVDAAKKGKSTSDLHSCQCWGRRGARKIFLARLAGRWDYPEFEQHLRGFNSHWNAVVPGGLSGCLIEDQANGTTYIQFNKETSEVPLVDFQPSRDTPGKDKSKPARKTYIERAAEGAQLLLPDSQLCPWVEEWITNICGESRWDDSDSCSQLFIRWATDAQARGWDATVTQGKRSGPTSDEPDMPAWLEEGF